MIGVASAKASAATATISAAAALLEQSWDAPRDFGLSLEATLAAGRAKITVESVLGAYELHGTQPPLSIYFPTIYFKAATSRRV